MREEGRGGRESARATIMPQTRWRKQESEGWEPKSKVSARLLSSESSLLGL